MNRPHIVFQLATPRTQEDAMSAWMQILSGLPPIQDLWHHRLRNQAEHCSQELLWQDGTLRFFITVPSRIAPQLTQLIAGWLPESLLIPQSSDPLLSLRPNSNQPLIAAVALKTTRMSMHETVDSFPSDPLVGLYAGLTSLPPAQTVAVQVIISPTVRATTRASPPTSTPTQEENSNSSAVMRKTEKAFRLSWNIGAAGADSAELEQTLASVASAFDVFTQSDSRFFRVSKPTFGAAALRPLLTRQHHLFKTQVVSNSLAAALLHPAGIHMASLPNISWGKFLAGEPPAHLPVVHKEMSAESKGEINPFATTVYKNRQVIYGLERSDRRRHMYVIGKTGTGKSTLLANMAINDLKNDEGLCVIDPHGDLVETLLDYIPSRRINDVIYFDPSDSERTVKLNLFEGKSVVHRELIASGIVSVFKKLYGYSWGPRLEHILRNALLTLLKSDDARLSDISELLTNQEFRRRIVDQLDDPILKSFWVNEFDSMQERLRTEAVAPVLNKVGQFVSSPIVRDVVNARKSSFSIEEVMDQGKILLVNLSQGRLGEDNATLLGAMLITKIQLAAMARVHQPENQRRDFYMYVDEFQNFATESFAKILSEARKYRLNLTLANQYTAQIPEEVQKAIFGNCGSIISFVMGADDAQIFSQEFSGKYTPNDLVKLQKHQIINRLSIDNIISEAFPAHTLPLARSANLNRQKVLQSSRERYAKKK